VFEHIRLLNHLRSEVEPLRRGKLINLFASGQQYAYGRETPNQLAIMVINNDKKDATIEFDVTRLRLPNGALLNDRLRRIPAVQVRDGRLRVALPQRSAAILTVPRSIGP
jgi:hypothetical protein